MSRAEAKTHARIDNTAEDTLIDGMIKAARQWAEQYCQRAFVTQTLVMHLDGFPGGYGHFPDWGIIGGRGSIHLPRSPLQSVTEIRYTDTDNTTKTLDSSRYRVDTVSLMPRIEPEHDESWPTTLYVNNAVEVEFKAGYGNSASDVPMAIRHAIKILFATLYDPARQSTVVGTSAGSIPFAAEALLGPYRVNGVPNP